MEIKTCEQYVLNELTKAQEEAENANNIAGNLQTILFTLQSYLELSMNADGFIYIDVDEAIDSDPETKNLLIKLFGRGKYDDVAAADVDDDADAEDNVEA